MVRTKSAFSQVWLPTVVIVLLIGLYSAFVLTYTVNLPQEDDIPALLDSVLTYKPASLLDALAILRRHNEHVITWARLASLLVVLAGQSKWLILVLVWSGQLWLLGLAWQGYRSLESKLTNGWLYLPVIGFIFNAQHQITSLWAMALWSNVPILFFAFACFYHLVQRHFVLASALALAATLSNGNGILVFGIGTLLLVIVRPRSQDWLVWVAFAVVGGLALSFSLQGPSVQTYQIYSLPLAPVSLLAFLGSALALVGGKVDIVLSIMGGIVVCACGAWATIKTWQEVRTGKPSAKMLMLLAMLAFTVLTGIAVALFRSEKGLSVIIGSRYRHYSCLAFVITYVLLLHLFPSKRPRLIMSASILAVAIALFSYPRQIAARLPVIWRIQADAHNLATTRNFPQLIVSGFDSTYADAVQASLQAAPAPLAAQIQGGIPSKISFKEDDKGPDLYICRQHYTLQTDQLLLRSEPDSGTFGALLQVGGADTLLFPAEGRRSYLAWLLRKPQIYVPGAKAQLFTCGLHGRYAVAWLEGHRLYPTADTLMLP